LEAFRIAVAYMTPVILLTDGYLANGAEPWRVPSADSLAKIEVKHPAATNGEKAFQPYLRNETLTRPWAIPGTPGLQHRIGGLEKRDGSGEVCYDPDNHEHMIRTRREKINKIADTIPLLEVIGADSGDLLVLGWGSTYGAITTAVERCQERGISVSGAHLRYLDPLPRNTESVLKSFRQVLIPEMNLGQLRGYLRCEMGVDAIGLQKMVGKPFHVSEIEDKIMELQGNGKAL